MLNRITSLPTLILALVFLTCATTVHAGVYDSGKSPFSYSPRFHLGIMADYDRSGEDLVREVAREGFTPKLVLGIDWDYRFQIGLGLKYWKKEADVFRRANKARFEYIEISPSVSYWTSGQRVVQFGGGLRVPITLATVEQGYLTPRSATSVEVLQTARQTVIGLQPFVGFAAGPLSGVFKVRIEGFYNYSFGSKLAPDDTTKAPDIDWKRSQPNWGASVGFFIFL